MHETVTLIPVLADGALRGYDGGLPEVATEVIRSTVELYGQVGFEEPWIGYLALSNGVPVGTCAFKSAPQEGRVEIAWFTFPDFEGRGIATGMATRLLAIARPFLVVVAAQTLVERNASHRILEKLGFQHVETLEHPEDGTVLEWQLPGGTVGYIALDGDK